MVRSATGLNLRTEPGGRILSVLPDGASVKVFSTKKEWANVVYGEQSGWVMLEYLAVKEEAE